MKTSIIFLILPHVHLLDLAGADQVFFEAMDYGVDVQVEYCSFTDAVATSARLPFGILKHFRDVRVKTGDYIFIPGADIHYLLSQELDNELELFAWIHAARAAGAYLCTVCTGAFFLAKAGLLDGRRCTTHWKRTAELQEKFPRVQVQQNILFTDDDGILTSAGVTSGIDMALFIVSRLKDDYASFQVARELVVYTRRDGNQEQQSVFLSYRNHIHSGIHNVQDWIQDNLSTKATLEDLAEIACMSTRTLTRIFKKETGITINDYITLLRKERIQKLLKNPDMTKAEIARECGLQSERQVARLIYNR
jgi:transcriptional regulator GlxA family with amidase domain